MPRCNSALVALSVVLLGCAGFAAIQVGWLPIEISGAATGFVLDATTSSDGLEQIPTDTADDPESPGVHGVGRDTHTANLAASVEFASLANDDSLSISSSDFRRTHPDTLRGNDRSRSADNLVQTAPFSKSIAPTRSGRLLAVDEQPLKTATNPEPTSDLLALESEMIDEPPVRVAKRSNEEEQTFDFSEIDRQIKAGQLVEAHKALSKLYWQQPDLRSRVQERIDHTAKALYFSPQPHIHEPYIVQPGDQLRKIAIKYHVPWQYLARLNRTDPKRLREGQKLKVIGGPFGAVVTLSDFELTLHLGGQYVRSYPCCIGKNNSTPLGKFKVLNKVTSPQYTDPDGKVFSGSDPQNPLGTHWIDLGDSYGIHGTIDPDSIGKSESRGCIRLLNADVSEVYDMLDIGAEVVIRQ